MSGVKRFYSAWSLTTLGLIAVLATVAQAADPGDVTRKRADLEVVQRQIRELEQLMATTAQTHSAAAAQLAQAERAVSEANRRLRQLAQERASNENELAQRLAEQKEVESRIAGRQEELGQWLRHQYVHGGNEVAPFLSGTDPNQIARDARYLEHIGRARLALIAALREDLRAREELVASIAVRQERVEALAAEQRSERAGLNKVLAARATAVAELSAQIKGQEREVRFLRENEEQLGRVVDLLARQAEQRAAARRDVTSPAAAVPTRAAPSLGEVRRRAGPGSSEADFATLRGQMGFPVRGELVGRFGAQRPEGGARWRGLFIRAGSGEDVVAIAAGEVVFSDWMRGYGNLIIVDHGNDYLTIYGNNDSLLRVVGERIDGGTPIASVGASGGVQESGLYFEIRHKGEPVDPMQWMRPR